ncbi:AraC family transcriptional regulator [Phenylobacterium sp.]|uniref:AraC family transcriptional regulator n=1 Tax=Phenylobacterium sp. TaxID=1871053 RepID=UPI002733063D|nr:AraC family transcriptional regulator [Phenylobacterium sp.]MDP3854900.1 AraC family transcriptional regulator ligand-binding domain-containing protein [Phenylobacterium sp.]
MLGGLDLDTLLSRSLVAPDATHVTSDQHTLLMLNSIDMTGDEAHALGAGRLNHGFASLGLRTMLSTSALGPALEVLARYFATCSSVFRMRIEPRGDFVEISLRAEGRDEARCEVLEEIWFNALYAFMCWFVGRRLPVMAATVARLDDPLVQRVYWATNAPLSRGETSSLLLPRACLQWRRLVEDVEEPVWEALRFWMDDDVGPHAQAGLRSVFSRFETPARTRLDEAFYDHGVGDRQMSRRIKAEYGATFRDLRGDALVDVATRMLQTTDVPIDEIGAQLGYAEERSFRRFLRNRAGQTPAQIRRAGARAPRTPDEAVRSRIHALTRKMEL